VTQRPLCLVTIIGLVVISACAGSSESSSASSSSTSTTATKAAASTVSDDGLATAASVQLADLGPAWTEYQKVGGFKATDKDSCNAKFGSPLTAGDPVYVAPMLRDQTEQTYISTTVFIFETKAQAQAFTTVRNTEEFEQCKGAEDDAAQQQRDPKSFVKLEKIDGPALEDGLEAFYQEQAGVKDADGADVVTSSYARYTIRKGRVVYVVSMDTALPADAAQRNALGDRITASLNASTAAITARLDALDVRR
jgi:hypothetical protein